jgi:Arc/MetJ-type ribon-helix-helix transcriptional regulator
MQLEIKSERYDEYIPVRITTTMKRDLERVIRKSITPSLSDHVRYALRLYIEANTPITEAEARTMEAQPL